MRLHPECSTALRTASLSTRYACFLPGGRPPRRPPPTARHPRRQARGCLAGRARRSPARCGSPPPQGGRARRRGRGSGRGRLWWSPWRAGASRRRAGEAENGAVAVELAREALPDVVILDLAMPILGGREALGLILSEVSPPPGVVILTMHDRPRLVRELLEMGASAFLAKSASLAEIIAAVKSSRPKRPPQEDSTEVSPATQEHIARFLAGPTPEKPVSRTSGTTHTGPRITS